MIFLHLFGTIQIPIIQNTIQITLAKQIVYSASKLAIQSKAAITN